MIFTSRETWVTTCPSGQATVRETLELLEYLVLLCPVGYLMARVLDLQEWIKPEFWCCLQLFFVVLLAVRERLRRVGDKEKLLAAAAAAKEPTPPHTATLSTRIKHFLTSTQCGTDRHKPAKTFVKGLSCFLFALPALEICFFAEPHYSLDRHEVYMLLSQCVFSFMADYAMVPFNSIWHPADRISALLLTLYGLVKPFVMGYNMEDTFCAYVAVAAVCVYFSQVARRHHGLQTHHVHHALFHVVVASGWSYTSLCVFY